MSQSNWFERIAAAVRARGAPEERRLFDRHLQAIRDFLSLPEETIQRREAFLEVGIENTPTLKLSWIPRGRSAEQALLARIESEAAFARVCEGIKRCQLTFAWGIKVSPGGAQFELYLFEDENGNAYRQLFADRKARECADWSPTFYGYTEDHTVTLYQFPPEQSSPDRLSPFLDRAPGEIPGLEYWHQARLVAGGWQIQKHGVQLHRPESAWLQSIARRMELPYFASVLDLLSDRPKLPFANLAVDGKRRLLYACLNHF